MSKRGVRQDKYLELVGGLTDLIQEHPASWLRKVFSCVPVAGRRGQCGREMSLRDGIRMGLDHVVYKETTSAYWMSDKLDVVSQTALLLALACKLWAGRGEAG